MPYAAIAGGIISLFSNVLGGIIASDEQKKAQAKAQNAMNNAFAAVGEAKNLSNEQLNMYKEQMKTWEETFGSVQKNLSSYYNSLDASHVSAQYIQDIEKEFNRSNEMMQSEMARRGMIDSGTAQAAQQSLYNNLATARAEARYKAPQDVARQQQGFFQGLGLPQQGQLFAGLSNSYGNLQNAYLNEARLHQGVADMYVGQAGQAGKAGAGAASGIGSALGGIIQGVGGLFGNSGGDNADGVAGGATGSAMGITQPAKPAWDLNKSWISQYTGGF